MNNKTEALISEANSVLTRARLTEVDAERADARAWVLALHTEQPRLMPPFLFLPPKDEPEEPVDDAADADPDAPPEPPADDATAPADEAAPPEATQRYPRRHRAA